MAENPAQERTEAPTTKRREDARQEGVVAMSREIPSAALLGTFALFFMFLGRFALQQIQGVWQSSFSHIVAPDLTVAETQRLVIQYLMALAPTLGVLFLLVFAVALLATVLQVGVAFNPLKFQIERLNPLAGLGRLFSMDGLAELLKGLFKMGVIGYITYITLQQEMTNLVAMARLPLQGILVYNFNLLATLLMRVALAMAILAVLDYLYQRWSYERRLRMTRQEMREELRQTEGDPQLRSRIRQLQREMSRARMMQNVPKADVVVTNPTHYAVALMYDREIMQAPRLVAKGADFVAQRIKAIAKENNVPLVENQTVARELYTQVDIGQEVPESFFRAIAEILAFVYRLKGKTAEGRAR